MALDEEALADFHLLRTKLSKEHHCEFLEPTIESLHRMLLIARDSLDDDEVIALLVKYSSSDGFEPITGVTREFLRASRRVCMIENGGGLSTGILIGPDLVLTTLHSFRGDGRFPHPEEIKVTFDRFRFKDDDKLYELQCRVLPNLDGTQPRVVASSMTDEEDNGLDYVIFRLESLVGLDILRFAVKRRRGWMDGNIVRIPPKGEVSVLQHPTGQLMKFSRGQVDAKADGLAAGHFHYTAPTKTGSSGSPVLNQRKQLVGLHSVGDNGAVQQLISFKAIVQDLRKKEKRLPRFPPKATFWDAFNDVTVDRGSVEDLA